MDSAADRQPPILLTGATGYIGGRLLHELEARGRAVRCLARHPGNLAGRVGAGTEVVAGDMLDPKSLERALEGVGSAYYLVHSLGAPGAFEEEDRRAARNFAAAARRAGVGRIIYLGGLGESGGGLSAHLRSRQEVGEILRESDAQVIELRAAVVIGSGSLSFEMIRALVERLPVMITPRWVEIPTQPIAIGDVVAYLLAALEAPAEGSRVFEIGGADVVSYGGLMREYARQRGLRRVMVRVPVLTPYLSSLWLGLVTPIYARVGRKLIDGIRHATVVHDPSAREVFGIEPMGVREAIAAALRNEDRELAQTHWADAVSSAGQRQGYGGMRLGSRLVDARVARVAAPAEAAFAVVERIGGAAGWYYGNWLWKVRGWLDLLAGGVGLRRGRRDPERLRVGDRLDFWRVEALEPGRRLRLAAEMRLPGRAWLEFEVKGEGEGDGDGEGCTIHQTAIFDPGGLSGLAYWYALWPLHQFVFAGMLRGIARAAAVSEST